jgi:hypothetical protein
MIVGGDLVPTITIPVGQAVYDSYKDTLALPDDERPRTHELALNGMLVRGRWVLIGIRADYVLGNDRTFWLTFRWDGDQ